MKKQNIYLLTIFSIFILSAAFFAKADAAMDLKNMVNNLFKWGIGMAGLLAAITFAVGAVQYAVSFHAEGKDKMFGSILGLILTLSGWIILQTINPKLTQLNFQNLPPGAGIFYVKGNEKATAPMSEADTTSVLSQGYTDIEYKCLSADYAPRLLVYGYKNHQFNEGDTALGDFFMLRLTCGDRIPIGSYGSLKIEIETTGVYLCYGNNCGYCIGPYTSDQENIPSPPFTGSGIRSLVLVNNLRGQNPTSIGVITHENPDLSQGGNCGDVNASIGRGADPTCYKVADNVNAINVFYMSQDAKNAGSGVTFFSEPTGWNPGPGHRPASIVVPPNDIKAPTMLASGETLWSKDPKKMTYNWGRDVAGTSVSEACLIESSLSCIDEQSTDTALCCDQKNFKDRQGSMQIRGNYLVMLSSKLKTGSGPEKFFCHTYKNDVTDFSQSDIWPSGDTDKRSLGAEADETKETYDFFRVLIIPTTQQ